MDNSHGKRSCCSDAACCQPDESKVKNNVIVLEYLYLDNKECDPCSKNEEVVDEAVYDLNNFLNKFATTIELKKVHIDSIKKARDYRITSSPTIRINGTDIQLEAMDEYCKSCSDISGEDTSCRVWIYQGRTYSVLPKELLIELILKQVYSENKNDIKEELNYEVPENIIKFFEGKMKKAESKSKPSCCCGSSNKCC